MSGIGLPPGMTPDAAYIQGMADAEALREPQPLTIELVDAPDAAFGGRESQRVYKVTDGTTKHTVRIQRDPDTAYRYVVENLVSGRWHRLLYGDLTDLSIPFDDAVKRAAAVLL